MEIYNSENSLSEISKNKIPFNESELIEYTKFAIPQVYNYFSSENTEKLQKYCDNELITKVLKDKETYRVTKDIDSIRVGFATLKDFSEKDDKTYIKVFTSVFFFDDVSNNQNSIDGYDKYWNDNWTITFERNTENQIINKCPNCGALMEFNNSKNMFTCEYCRNSIYYSRIDWKIVDITVNEINYK